MGNRDILDLDAFRALHPWPDHMIERGSPLECLWFWDLEADREALWNHLTDTSRFNRALGLSEMRFEEHDGKLHGESRNGGVRQVWIEQPWDWVTGQSLQSIRIFSRGFAHVSRGIYRFQQLDDRTVRYYAYFGWIPRNFLGRLILRTFAPGMLKKGYDRVIAALMKDIAHARNTPRIYQLTENALSADARRRVASIREEMADRLGASSWTEATEATELTELADLTDLIDRLIDHISTGDELDLYRIQVRALAREWGVDEIDLLRVCLHATRAGLLTMSWDIICPHCRGVRQEARNLGDVPTLGACEVCEIDFSTDKENSIEITFHVHPSIRGIAKRFFCSAEPASKLHVRAQKRLDPGQSEIIEPSLAPGRYRMRLIGEKRFRFLDVMPAHDADRVAWRATETGDVTAGANPTIELINDRQAPHIFVLETALWADVALRPAHLFNVQEFRDLFSEEYLAAEIQLDVGEQTILFTDMVGSTRFYANRGDPDAFVEIKKHFKEVYEIVSSHHGAVVKTIGDAVMAAFHDPLDAVKASHHIHQCFHEHREDSPIRLRISVNTGPCIAVNFNSNIDYFGGTVNLAAKLQACAEAGEIAMAPAVADAPGVREYLAGQDAVLEHVSFTPRALHDAISVTRWCTYQARAADRDPA